MQKECSLTIYFNDEYLIKLRSLYKLPQFINCKSDEYLTIAVLEDYTRIVRVHEKIKQKIKIDPSEVFKLIDYHSRTIKLMKLFRSAIDDWISEDDII